MILAYLIVLTQVVELRCSLSALTESRKCVRFEEELPGKFIHSICEHAVASDKYVSVFEVLPKTMSTSAPQPAKVDK